jgi:hypothetical protein
MHNFAKFAKATTSIWGLGVLLLVIPEQRWYFYSFFADVHLFNLRSFNLSHEAEFLEKIQTKVLRVCLLTCTTLP